MVETHPEKRLIGGSMQVELGLERHIDDPGELGIRDHLEPNLLDQFSNALAVDSHRKRD